MQAWACKWENVAAWGWLRIDFSKGLLSVKGRAQPLMETGFHRSPTVIIPYLTQWLYACIDLYVGKCSSVRLARDDFSEGLLSVKGRAHQLTETGLRAHWYSTSWSMYVGLDDIFMYIIHIHPHRNYMTVWLSECGDMWSVQQLKKAYVAETLGLFHICYANCSLIPTFQQCVLMSLHHTTVHT